MSRDVVDKLRRHGPLGAARLAAGRLRRAVRMRDRYIWYELRLDEERPRRELPDGFELQIARETRDLELFSALQSCGLTKTLERVRDGLPWLVAADGQAAFACWTFLRRTPVRALPSDWLELPEHVACLEDSVTGPHFRGRGIAPGAWTALADHLAGEGYRAIVTKVMDTNVPSRRAVEKAGFREVASFELVRTGPRVNLVARGDRDSTGAYLAREMNGSGRWLLT